MPMEPVRSDILNLEEICGTIPRLSQTRWCPARAHWRGYLAPRTPRTPPRCREVHASQHRTRTNALCHPQRQTVLRRTHFLYYFCTCDGDGLGRTERNRRDPSDDGSDASDRSRARLAATRLCSRSGAESHTRLR